MSELPHLRWFRIHLYMYTRYFLCFRDYSAVSVAITSSASAYAEKVSFRLFRIVIVFSSFFYASERCGGCCFFLLFTAGGVTIGPTSLFGLA